MLLIILVPRLVVAELGGEPVLARADVVGLLDLQRLSFRRAELSDLGGLHLRVEVTSVGVDHVLRFVVPWAGVLAAWRLDAKSLRES